MSASAGEQGGIHLLKQFPMMIDSMGRAVSAGRVTVQSCCRQSTQEDAHRDGQISWQLISNGVHISSGTGPVFL